MTDRIDRCATPEPALGAEIGLKVLVTEGLIQGLPIGPERCLARAHRISKVLRLARPQPIADLGLNPRVQIVLTGKNVQYLSESPIADTTMTGKIELLVQLARQGTPHRDEMTPLRVASREQRVAQLERMLKKDRWNFHLTGAEMIPIHRLVLGLIVPRDKMLQTVDDETCLPSQISVVGMTTPRQYGNSKIPIMEG